MAVKSGTGLVVLTPSHTKNPDGRKKNNSQFLYWPKDKPYGQLLPNLLSEGIYHYRGSRYTIFPSQGLSLGFQFSIFITW